jgi:hypothetical protein
MLMAGVAWKAEDGKCRAEKREEDEWGKCLCLETMWTESKQSPCINIH